MEVRSGSGIYGLKLEDEVLEHVNIKGDIHVKNFSAKSLTSKSGMIAATYMKKGAEEIEKIQAKKSIYVSEVKAKVVQSKESVYIADCTLEEVYAKNSSMIEGSTIQSIEVKNSSVTFGGSTVTKSVKACNEIHLTNTTCGSLHIKADVDSKIAKLFFSEKSKIEGDVTVEYPCYRYISGTTTYGISKINGVYDPGITVSYDKEILEKVTLILEGEGTIEGKINFANCKGSIDKSKFSES